MRPSLVHVAIAATFALLTGCGDAGFSAQELEVEGGSHPLINGEDDRREVYSFGGDTFARATQSFVALLPPYNVEKLAAGRYGPNPDSLADIQQVCPDEPFADQPAAAGCSGVLIDDDLVLTAGHCFPSEEVGCDYYSYVFDYHFSRPGQAREITDLDVYGCKKLLVRKKQSYVGGLISDFAIVQLDRKVDLRRRPVPLRLGAVVANEAITVIGSPEGLPGKIDAGGMVQAEPPPARSHWYANTDTFQGNSGSPGFDADLNLVGILIQGGADLEPDPEQPCLRPRRIQAGQKDSGVEKFAYVAPAIAALCATEEGATHSVCDPSPPVKGDVNWQCSHVGARDRSGGSLWAFLLLALALGLWQRRKQA